MEDPMQVAKWGNSLAIRLPKEVVDMLNLKEGDDIEIIVAGTRRLDVERDKSRAEAIEEIKRLAKPLPPGFKFNRDEANER
jgi:antitoxin MazE